jgi:hypothetical protein
MEALDVCVDYMWLNFDNSSSYCVLHRLPPAEKGQGKR